MASYDNDLRLKEITTGDEDGTWGTSTNTNLELIAEALGYATEASFSSDANATTTVADGATDPARAMYFKVTSSGALTATRTLTIAPSSMTRVMFIENATSGSQSIAISQGSGGNVTIGNGKTKVVYLDGAGAGAAVVDISSLLDLATLSIGGTAVTAILDEDTMSSDSATALATQQSIKAYVDANAGGSLATTLTTGNSTGGTNIVVTAGDSITTDTIAETTAASGVTVDGLLIKDSSVFLGGSTSANQLDDYEEGTFTFVVEDASDNAITNDTSTGYYTKVGELVFVSIDINAVSLGSASGALRIDGLPFSCSGSKLGPVAIAGESANLNITAGYTIVGDFVESAPRMNLYIWDSATGTSSLTAAELSSDGQLKISGSYFAA